MTQYHTLPLELSLPNPSSISTSVVSVVSGEMNVSSGSDSNFGSDLVVTLLRPDAQPSYDETLVQIITSFNKEIFKIKHNLQSHGKCNEIKLEYICMY